MDYEMYRKKYFAEPAPSPRFRYSGLHGATLYYENYRAAVGYYTRVLGPPEYVEGEGTRGWRIGNTWLTLLQGHNGNPTGVEIAFVMTAPADAAALQKAFIEAGGRGPEPSEQLMYRPVYACPVQDPFGTQIMIYADLETSGQEAG